MPPKLPQSDDYDEALDSELLQAAITGVRHLKALLHDETTSEAINVAIDGAIDLLHNTQKVHSGSIVEADLLQMLDRLVEDDTSVSLHIRAQNAGILITKTDGGDARFDLFELAPTNEAAMGTKGRLRRSFPAVSVLVPGKTLRDQDFRTSIAHTLAEMSRHAVVGQQPQVKKAGSLHNEDRDTTHPGIVTELFAGFLSSLGRSAPAPEVVKCMREEVLWSSARSPWRRSASWTLIRVALQLNLTRATGSDNLYKQTMLCIMTQVLKRATECASALPTDMLYSMGSKIGRRVLKLESDIYQSVVREVNNTLKGTRALVEERWKIVRDENARPLNRSFSKLSKSEFEQDASLRLLSLDQHIADMQGRPVSDSTCNFVPKSGLTTYPADQLPVLPDYGSNDDYALANLQAFEEWVALHSSNWSRARVSKSSWALENLIKEYHNCAQGSYADDPESLSNMILTIFELWISADEAALRLCPLLEQYDPGVKTDVLENLILPRKGQMERLHAVERYFRHRSSKSGILPYTKLFSDQSGPDCFAVRYFDSSYKHQNALDAIEVQAQREKDEAINTFRQLKDRHERLMSESDGMECSFVQVVVNRANNFRKREHSNNCTKCSKRTEAQHLQIDIHEWPLPRNRPRAKAVVFELLVPAFYASWREATFYLLKDVLKMEYAVESSPRTQYNVRSDQQLRQSSDGTARGRVTLLSEDKPNLVTHRKSKKISLTSSENGVCFETGLNYRYFDTESNNFIGHFSFNDKVARSITYVIPTRSRGLQKYVFRPSNARDGPSPNTSIACRFECPEEMTLEEFTHLSSLPLGHHIQWHNILVQIAAPSVDFKKDETALFVFQCIYQAGGSNGTPLRAAHSPASEDQYGHTLLECLRSAFERVKENWESAQTVAVFAAIASRLLSLSSSSQVQQRCLDFLRVLRNTSFGWVELLRNKAQSAVAHTVRNDFRSKSVDAAFICAICADVEDRYLAELLGPSEGASILLQCSIVIQEGKRQYSKTSEPVLYLLKHRFRRLIARCTMYLSANHEGLDEAIQQSWSGYRPGYGWKVALSSTDPWLTTKTTMNGNDAGLIVHYNVLTGELLVNGLPLDRPPRRYEEHSMWETLFGQSAVEVMPTSIPGMHFSAKRRFQGFDVHFGLDSSGTSTDLLVRASAGAVTYETIPSRLFQGKLPQEFVDTYVHWYKYGEDVIEFRPVGDPWNQTPTATWILRREGRSSWKLSKDGHNVIGSDSNIASAISEILSPVATGPRIHCILEPTKDSIEIDIPKIELGFKLDVRKSNVVLHSRDYPGMAIDEDQSLDTLVGFSTKLMLKHTTSGARSVLLPEGPVTAKPSPNHVHVWVDTDAIVKVHPFGVDTCLGRLVDNGSLQGKLFLAQAHALTAYCLPDLLTGKTGTEQALTILDSAATRSFDQLSKQNIAILEAIARLAPARSYYPKHEKVMQTVSWSSRLSFIAQHNDFYHVVLSIFEQAGRSTIFYPDSDGRSPDMSWMDRFLLERDSIRSSFVRVSSFGAEHHTVAFDAPYLARDANQGSNRGSQAHVLSTIVFKGSDKCHYGQLSVGSLWRTLAECSAIFGPNCNVINRAQLRYSVSLVEAGLDFAVMPELHRLLKVAQAPPRLNKYELMIWLSTLAASEKSNLRILQLVGHFFTADSFRQIALPNIESCRPSEGYQATFDKVSYVVRAYLVPLNESPEDNMPSFPNESWDAFRARRDRQFTANQDSAVNDLANEIYHQWPSATLAAPNLAGKAVKTSEYVRVNEAVHAAKEKFRLWFDNKLLHEYLQGLELTVARLSVAHIPAIQWSRTNPAVPPRPLGFIPAQALFHGKPPALCSSKPVLSASPSDFLGQQPDQTPRLFELIGALRASSRGSKYETNYVNELEKSLECLRQQPGGSRQYATPCGHEDLRQYLQDCAHYRDGVLNALLLAVKSPPIANCRSLLHTGQWPRMSTTFFLSQLSARLWKQLSSTWQARIVAYGLALTALHRAERLVKTAGLPNIEDFANELANTGHSNWHSFRQPEWLLLEIESGITIRDVQTEIADEMIAPRSSRNTVMQLNMGEGKSSVIVPMVATALADGSRLVRVIVAKPQSKQMAQMLIAKLGGLVGRRVCYMPFSRALRFDKTNANQAHRMLQDCMTAGDVLLVQPEHILSFQLMGLECLSCAKDPVGLALLQTQDFFDAFSRDIVDESDEQFQPKFELIYTMGSQRSIEFSPGRWACIQQVLELVKASAAQFAIDFPSSLEVAKGPTGCFPRIRILKQDLGQLLLTHVANRICEIGMDGFPIARQPENVRNAVLLYITKYDLTSEEITIGEKSSVEGFCTETTRPLLLLLRGLFAGGVLAFIFGQKRWRVNYGLAPARDPATKLAVPYRAKDQPSARSEFSHPDVVIALTSLSYYYGGLEENELFTTFGNLMHSDQKDVEYRAWIHDIPSIPTAFRHLGGINIRDKSQCKTEVFPHLKYSKAVVDYFLSNIVFPKEMKEFPLKLSASGWDIGKNKTQPITGFSGTNDSRKLLPLDVKQLDLSTQKHTNALVPEYLLQPENTVVLASQQRDHELSDAAYLLQTVISLDPPAKVILDAGANVLELKNRQVAQSWLNLSPGHTKAVVFVNDDDELCILDRKGRDELLQTSPYAGQLDICLVYLDEAHTRGIDLKLPRDYRAAVTLGMGLTKDRLIQGTYNLRSSPGLMYTNALAACMRMRKLGKGQSVVFIANQEIEGKIRERTANLGALGVKDVLHWAIGETFSTTRRDMPLWAVQGGRFLRQERLWDDVRTDGTTSMSRDQAEKFLEDEAQSLEQRYHPHDSTTADINQVVASSNGRANEIEQRCSEFENLQFNSSTLQEEQERELSPEIEQERQVQRAQPARPLVHSLHADVVRFYRSGTVVYGTEGYMPAFKSLNEISARETLRASYLANSGALLVTADFANTVRKDGGKTYVSDEYHRPVQWIVTHRDSNNVITRMMVLSPFEAEQLLSSHPRGKNVAVHLYKPRTNAAYRTFERVDFFTIPAEAALALEVPPNLVIELNLFAGQHYLTSYDDYLQVCKYLGLATETPKAGERVAADGFILEDADGVRVRASPVKFLQTLMSTIRANGKSISKTHMGRILDGNLLQRKDFEERSG